MLGAVRSVLPRKRKLACFAIATMAYLRGPSLLNNNEFDPNVAHAGIKVEVSSVRVEATMKDLPPLLPIKAAAKAPRTIVKTTKDSVPSEAKRDIKKIVAPVPGLMKKMATSEMSNMMASSPVTLVFAAGGGILAGTHARRKGTTFGSEDGLQQMDDARGAKSEAYVEEMLKEDSK